MRTASRTAGHVALFRALESRRGDRLFVDDFAARFLPVRYRWLVRVVAQLPWFVGTVCLKVLLRLRLRRVAGWFGHHGPYDPF